MRRVLVNTQNFLFGDAISEALRRSKMDFDVMKAEKPEEVVEISKWYVPYALLMEVTAYTPWLLEERLKIRSEVKKINPQCKIVLIVDENTEKELARRVLQAKKDGLIDNFLYGSVSATYLTAVIDSL